MNKIISISAIARMFKAADKRISAAAKKIMAIKVQEYAEEIASKAIKNAMHFGRKTIQKEDVIK